MAAGLLTTSVADGDGCFFMEAGEEVPSRESNEFAALLSQMVSRRAVRSQVWYQNLLISSSVDSSTSWPEDNCQSIVEQNKRQSFRSE